VGKGSLMSEIKHSIFTIHRETLVDKLVQNLLEAIFSGKRPPKSKISEVGIATEFGVSRVPAREALQRLEEMNLVRKTHLGREVVQFSREEFEQIYELKNVVEAFGAMKGALNAGPTEIEKIEAIIGEMADVIARNDIDRLQCLNHEFHDSLVFCCNNPKVIESFSSLAKQVRWAMPISMQVRERPVLGYREHQEIFAAFRRREAEKVRYLLETHSNANMKRILAQMASRG
jgi:DNA-binding GntR family transcriptional regulator